jgi:hypothetical protein
VEQIGESVEGKGAVNFRSSTTVPFAFDFSHPRIASQDTSLSDSKPAAKRELEASPSIVSPSSKKARVDDKKSSFSNLLKKMNPSAAITGSSKQDGTATSLSDTTKAGSDSTKAIRLGDLSKKGE